MLILWNETERNPSNRSKAIKGLLCNASACLVDIMGQDWWGSEASAVGLPEGVGDGNSCRCVTTEFKPVGPVWIPANWTRENLQKQTAPTSQTVSTHWLPVLSSIRLPGETSWAGERFVSPKAVMLMSDWNQIHSLVPVFLNTETSAENQKVKEVQNI